MKKAFFSIIVGLTIGCAMSGTLFAADAPAPNPMYTGTQGDAGDPNSAAASAIVANQSPTQTQPAAAESQRIAPSQAAPQANAPAPSAAAPDNNTAPAAAEAPALANPSAFGSTNNGRTAFTRMLRNLMPLDPNQIVTLRTMFDQSQKAVVQYPGTPPKPTSSSILVNMSPGATPPVIRLRSGYVTSLVFLDSTGQPWPVVGYDLGNPKAFDIQPSAPDGKSNTLIIQALERYEQGNLAIMLKGENTPVMLTLIPGQRAVDYRVDLRIPGLGPNALVAMNGLPQTENPILLNFLDGTPPQGAKLLTVEGAAAQAWSYQGFVFLRARLTILSPGWLATMSSPDGTHVYELAKTPVILASQRGEMVQLSIKGL